MVFGSAKVPEPTHTGTRTGPSQVQSPGAKGRDFSTPAGQSDSFACGVPGQAELRLRSGGRSGLVGPGDLWVGSAQDASHR